MNELAQAIGIEARAKHNGFVHTGNRLDQMGITFYAPNINLVKDPRWGRAQEVYGEVRIDVKDEWFVVPSIGTALKKSHHAKPYNFL